MGASILCQTICKLVRLAVRVSICLMVKLASEEVETAFSEFFGDEDCRFGGVGGVVRICGFGQRDDVWGLGCIQSSGVGDEAGQVWLRSN